MYILNSRRLFFFFDKTIRKTFIFYLYLITKEINVKSSALHSTSLESIQLAVKFSGMHVHFHLLLLTFANYFSWMTASETCENTVIDIYGEGSYLTGPLYANAEMAYTVSRSSVLKVDFVYNRTNGLTGLNKIARKNNRNQVMEKERVLTFAATESSLTPVQQAQFPELLMIPVEAM